MGCRCLIAGNASSYKGWPHNLWELALPAMELVQTYNWSR